MKKRIKEISCSFPNAVAIPIFSVMIVSLCVKTGSQSCLIFKINYLCYDMYFAVFMPYLCSPSVRLRHSWGYGVSVCSTEK